MGYVCQSNKYILRSRTDYDMSTKTVGSKPVAFSSLPAGLVYVEKSALFLTVVNLMNLARKEMDIFQL